MNKNFYLKLFSGFALVTGICACSESGKDTAGGVSEETEGIYAVQNKTVAGVSQKGPFVTGSNVYLRETEADSSLTPTGKEFFATIRNNKGEFKIENISLKNPYALLTVEGYYAHEFSDETSPCQIRLNAVSNIEKRDSVNINVLTHFEFQRVLHLVKSGISFERAKQQASEELMRALEFDPLEKPTENLDITITSIKENKMLLILSAILDYQNKKAMVQKPNGKLCQDIQDNIDSFANDFGDDGLLSDSTHTTLVEFAYNYYDYVLNYLEKSENIYLQTELFKVVKQDILDYCYRLFVKYAELDSCNMDNWGETVNFTKPLQSPKKTDHLLCTGYSWTFINQSEYDNYTKIIDHQVSSMTDPRDGKTYRTVSFTSNGKTYEWMGENLTYSDTLPRYAMISYDTILLKEGEYTWSEAMNVEPADYKDATDSTFIDPAKDITDSIHQGLCPDGWHIPTSKEWNELFKYVGGPDNLKNKNWINNRTIPTLYNRQFYVFHDKIEFELEPDFNELYTIERNFSEVDTVVSISSKFHTYSLSKDFITDLEKKYNYSESLEPVKYQEDYFHVSISPSEVVIFEKPISNQVASIRCIKN